VLRRAYDSIEVVKALLAAGADPNICSVKSITPLQVAANNDRLQPCKLLVEAGA
jgi:ankyrin repeat protein